MMVHINKMCHDILADIVFVLHVSSQEEFVNTKWVIRIRYSANTIDKRRRPKERGRKKEDERTNNVNDLQNITQKTKDRATRTPLRTGGYAGALKRVSSSCSTSGICSVTLVTNPVYIIYGPQLHGIGMSEN
jgi:hypothetical protein